MIDFGENAASGYGEAPPESIMAEWDLDYPLDDDLQIKDLPKSCPEDEDPVFKHLFSNLKWWHGAYKQTANIYSIRYLKELHYYFHNLNDAHNCQLYTSKFLLMCQELFGSQDHILTSDALFCMSRCCELTEKYAEGIKYAQKALEMRKKLLKDPNHPKFAGLMYRIGLYHQKMSENSKAIEFFLKRLQMFQEYYGHDSRNVVGPLKDVYECYDKMNDADNYLKYRNEAMRIKKALFKQKNSEMEYSDILLVRGKDNGQPAWHYILIENEEKFQSKRQLS